MNKWLRNGVLFAIAVFITSAALQGIIGNRADAAFTKLINWITTSIHENALPWFIVVLLIIFSITEGIYFWIHGKVLEQAIQRANRMIALDASLLRAIASWQPSKTPADREQKTQLILRDILRDATTEFNEQVFRAAIVTPDAHGEYLGCCASWQMPPESTSNMKFYIGSDNRMRREKGGVAGEVYLSEKMIIGHMVKLNDMWICKDCPSYTKFPENRPVQPYKSFVNVPIIGADPSTTSSRTKCFGVICFDSPHERIFDSDASKEILATVAQRVAATLITCERLP